MDGLEGCPVGRPSFSLVHNEKKQPCSAGTGLSLISVKKRLEAETDASLHGEVGIGDDVLFHFCADKNFPAFGPNPGNRGLSACSGAPGYDRCIYLRTKALMVASSVSVERLGRIV